MDPFSDLHAFIPQQQLAASSSSQFAVTPHLQAYPLLAGVMPGEASAGTGLPEARMRRLPRVTSLGWTEEELDLNLPCGFDTDDEGGIANWLLDIEQDLPPLSPASLPANTEDKAPIGKADNLQLLLEACELLQKGKRSPQSSLDLEESSAGRLLRSSSSQAFSPLLQHEETPQRARTKHLPVRFAWALAASHVR